MSMEYQWALSCLPLSCKGFHLSLIKWVLCFFATMFYAWWKGTTSLTDVSLTRLKTFTLSSLLLWTSLISSTGRLSAAGTPMIWLLMLMRPIWAKTHHQGPHYAGSGRGLWMHISMGILVDALWCLHVQWVEWSGGWFHTCRIHLMPSSARQGCQQAIQSLQAIEWLQVALQGTKPNHVTITNWVSHSWNQVSVESIMNTWCSLQLYPFDE